MGYSILLLIFYVALIHLVIPIAAQYCYDIGNYSSNNTYRANLNTLLASMYSNTEIDYGFYNFTDGESPNKVYAIVLCKGDILTNVILYMRLCVLGIWRKIRFLGFKILNFVILTSWLVLIFAFKWHHVFKTFLFHVHLHWVLKTYFKLFFYTKFLGFKSYKIYIVRPTEPYIWLIENVQFLGHKSLSGLIPARLMLDQSKFPKNFFFFIDVRFLSIDRISRNSHALHCFLYPSCIVTVISLIN